jgi:5S rRNA maturation endonuclease (ribonuclease M5)
MNQNVLELLKSKFGRVRAVSGGSFRIPCPTCDPKNGKKMKRYVSPGWSDSRCFICEQAVPIHELVGEHIIFERENLDSVVVEYKYAKILPYNDTIKLGDMSPDHPAITFLAKDHLANLAYYDSLGIRYITSTGGMNLDFDSGFIVNTADSLFFPIFGKDGTYEGWQIRFIPGTWNGDRFQFMRYMHLFPKGDHLFNYHFAKQYKDVVVVEGVKKALKLANAVATLGKGISTKQKQLIQEWKTITIILDGEDSTQELARELQAEFRSNGRKCINIDLRDYGFESPDDTTSEELQSIIQKEHAKQRG